MKTSLEALPCQDGEEWRKVPIAQFEEIYAVSNHGRVARLVDSGPSGRAGTFLNPNVSSKSKNKWAQVNLRAPGHLQKVVTVHRLVAMAFLGPAGSDLTLVEHLDGNLSNNHASNLAWVSPSSRSFKVIRPHGESHSRARLTEKEVREIRLQHGAGKSMSSIARERGVSKGCIERVVKRTSWKHVRD